MQKARGHQAVEFIQLNQLMEPMKNLERPTKIKACDDSQILNVVTQLIKVTGGKVHSLQNEGQLTAERRQVDPQFYFIYLFIFLGGQKRTEEGETDIK